MSTRNKSRIGNYYSPLKTKKSTNLNRIKNNLKFKFKHNHMRKQPSKKKSINSFSTTKSWKKKIINWGKSFKRRKHNKPNFARKIDNSCPQSSIKKPNMRNCKGNMRKPKRNYLKPKYKLSIILESLFYDISFKFSQIHSSFKLYPLFLLFPMICSQKSISFKEELWVCNQS